ncbi:MAG: hypothetical protein JRS35_26840 [Deltaproteobacteria bacterium]|nr:hypothetical protein [Deltaproteobacteria bacterium]
MRVRSEGVQMRALGREIGVRPRRRTWQYVEEPEPVACHSTTPDGGALRSRAIGASNRTPA